MNRDSALDLDLEPFRVGGVVRPPPPDIDRYLESVERCRRSFPQLEILAGLEISEPHLHPTDVAAITDDERFERVLSAVHAVAFADRSWEVSGLYAQLPPADVVRAYLGEIARMIETIETSVLAHIDYAARSWPAQAAPFRSADFEPECGDAPALDLSAAVRSNGPTAAAPTEEAAMAEHPADVSEQPQAATVQPSSYARTPVGAAVVWSIILLAGRRHLQPRAQADLEKVCGGWWMGFTAASITRLGAAPPKPLTPAREKTLQYGSLALVMLGLASTARGAPIRNLAP